MLKWSTWAGAFLAHVGHSVAGCSVVPLPSSGYCVLMENAGRVLSPEQLVTRVWGRGYADATGYVRRYVWYLRQKIEPDPANPQYIFTERGFGYVFRTD
ncbi:MAG: helix-turn-helix domain-containing protein [Anaerolineae bacterium]